MALRLCVRRLCSLGPPLKLPKFDEVAVPSATGEASPTCACELRAEAESVIGDRPLSGDASDADR